MHFFNLFNVTESRNVLSQLVPVSAKGWVEYQTYKLLTKRQLSVVWLCFWCSTRFAKTQVTHPSRKNVSWTCGNTLLGTIKFPHDSTKYYGIPITAYSDKFDHTWRDVTWRDVTSGDVMWSDVTWCDVKWRNSFYTQSCGWTNWILLGYMRYMSRILQLLNNFLCSMKKYKSKKRRTHFLQKDAYD